MVDVNLIFKLLLNYNLDSTFDVGTLSLLLKNNSTPSFCSQIYSESMEHFLASAECFMNNLGLCNYLDGLLGNKDRV